MVWGLALSPHSKKVPGSDLSWALSMWSLHVLLLHASVLLGLSGFLPQSKMHGRLVSVCDCARMFVGPVMDWLHSSGTGSKPHLQPCIE